MAFVSIDTSALQNVLSRDLVAAVTRRVIERQDITVISIHVLEEILCGNRPESIASRAQKIAALIDGLGERVVIGDHLSKYLMAEHSESPLVFPIPLPADELGRVTTFLASANPQARDFLQLNQSLNEILAKKARALETDENVQGFLAERGFAGTPENTRELEDYLNQFQRVEDSFEWYLESGFRAMGIEEVAPKPSHVFENLEKYRATAALLSLAQLTMNGATIPDSQNAIAIKFRPKPNNWYDNTVTAVAASGDLILADDDLFCQKIDFLRERGISTLRAQKLDEYLS